MKIFDIVAAVLLVIGGLNWGVVALMQSDLVTMIFGASYAEPSVLSRIVYALVGVAAVYQVVAIKAIQSRWGVVAKV